MPTFGCIHKSNNYLYITVFADLLISTQMHHSKCAVENLAVFSLQRGDSETFWVINFLKRLLTIPLPWSRLVHTPSQFKENKHYQPRIPQSVAAYIYYHPQKILIRLSSWFIFSREFLIYSTSGWVITYLLIRRKEIREKLLPTKLNQKKMLLHLSIKSAEGLKKKKEKNECHFLTRWILFNRSEITLSK